MTEESNPQNSLKFGRYQPIKVLGEGAMGRVYLAEDPFLKRKLAVKAIILDKNLDEKTRNEYNQRFIVEAQASAKLNHPSIVTIHDVGNDNQVPWIVFEYVEGESLIDIISRENALSLEQAITITLHIASALCVAHHHQIIHRDIKPANILIDSMTHIAKLADFGIAKAPWTELTQEGKTIGSPGYMSPEQIRGENLDERSDIFSLGVVLYLMITGTHPFLRDTMTNTLYATLEGSTKPIRDYVPNIPEGVCEIVNACIAPDKENRISSANELVSKLKKLHLASKTASFTFSTPKDNSPKLSISSKSASNFFQNTTNILKSGFTNIFTIIKSIIIPSIHLLPNKLKGYFPYLKHGIKKLSKYKSTMLISSATFLILFVLCVGKMTSLITGSKEILPLEDANNMAGLEKIKLSETEEQLIKQVKNLISSDDLNEAETVANTISQTKNISTYGHMLLGLIALKDEDYDDAYEAFENCLKEEKGKSVIKHNLPSLLFAVEDELKKEDAEDELLQIIVKLFNAAKNPIVNKWIKDEQYWLRWNAARIKQLSNTPIDSVNIYILDLQHAGSVRTRVRAAKTLGRFKDKRAIKPLKEAVARGFNDPILSVAAERVLENSFNVIIED